METAGGISTHTKSVGSLHLVLTEDINQNHVYTIPGCVYDPDSPLHILRVSTLGKLFKDSTNPNNKLGEDTVKSRAIKSHLIWDHSKHERHFLHRSSNLPDLYVYVGNEYFNAFCTRVHRLLSDKVHYAFFSAFSIQPTPTIERAA